VMCAGRPIESVCPFCFFNDTATTAISTLSLHDALPIYFTTLGVAAARGRALTADDTRPGGDALVAVVSDGLATRLLGGADAAVGRSIAINGVTVAVVGVAPPGFVGLWTDSEADVWLPLTLPQPLHYDNNSSGYA